MRTTSLGCVAVLCLLAGGCAEINIKGPSFAGSGDCDDCGEDGKKDIVSWKWGCWGLAGVCGPTGPAAAAAGPSWLALGAAMADDAADRQGPSGAPGADPAHTPVDRPYVPRAERRGPAYPGRLWQSFGRDAKELLPMIWEDTVATATNPVSLVMLGMAGAAGITLNASEVDEKIAGHYERRGHQLNGFWDGVGDVGGNPGLHFALAGALYFGSLAAEDVKNYETSKTMLSALAINGITTLALKGAARTNAPNGDPCGWPSGHTSSSFCMATVVYEAYGPLWGVPAYAFAAYVGYERIDARNHDFSDVISGALIGVAIGHAVAANHRPKMFGMDVVPYVDSRRGGVGLALAGRF